MKMGTKLITVFLAATLVSACTGQRSERVNSLQKKDKYLSCKEIQLEMNEAEFYRRTAEKNKGPSVQNVMMPLGYISTFMSAEDAIQASDARGDYLNRVYEILECDNPKGEGNRRGSTVNAQQQGGGMVNGPMPAMVVPQYVAPMGYQPMGYQPMGYQPMGYMPMSYSAPVAVQQPMPTYVAPEGANYSRKDWYAF
jgi:hypothetical protein